MTLFQQQLYTMLPATEKELAKWFTDAGAAHQIAGAIARSLVRLYNDGLVDRMDDGIWYRIDVEARIKP